MLETVSESCTQFEGFAFALAVNTNEKTIAATALMSTFFALKFFVVITLIFYRFKKCPKVHVTECPDPDETQRDGSFVITEELCYIKKARRCEPKGYLITNY